MIFRTLARSEGHKAVLLKPNIAYGLTQCGDIVYLCVRGWD
jgi:hypothetical protein